MSADTFGTLTQIAELLQASAIRARSGRDKLRELDKLGRDRCAVIGNGANDVLVLEAAALGFAVIGPEGACSAALQDFDGADQFRCSRSATAAATSGAIE